MKNNDDEKNFQLLHEKNKRIFCRPSSYAVCYVVFFYRYSFVAFLFYFIFHKFDLDLRKRKSKNMKQTSLNYLSNSLEIPKRNRYSLYFYFLLFRFFLFLLLWSLCFLNFTCVYIEIFFLCLFHLCLLLTKIPRIEFTKP